MKTDFLEEKSYIVKYKRIPDLEILKIFVVMKMAFTTKRLIGSLNSFVKPDSNQCTLHFIALHESVLFGW